MNDRKRRESPSNEKSKRKRRAANAEDLNIFGELIKKMITESSKLKVLGKII